MEQTRERDRGNHPRSPTIMILLLCVGCETAFAINRSGKLPQDQDFKKADVPQAKHGKARNPFLTRASYATTAAPAGVFERRVSDTASGECDRLAASPYDEDHKSAGVDFDLIDTPRAVQACHEAVAASPDTAQLMFQLGRALARNGDYSEARRWYEQAAARTSTLAMINLAYLYAEGLGVGRDYAKVRTWLEEAAARGNAIAMTNLGDLYAEGHGVVQNYARAFAWYELAAANGDAVAMNSLGILYDNGNGVLLDFAKAKEWYEKAAAKGEAAAMQNLGDLYRDGRGVARDHDMAQECYEKAEALVVKDRLDEFRRR